MARLSRLIIPGLPHHVALRGNNMQTIFSDAEDYEAFLQFLPSVLGQHKLVLHSYVLLPNELYMLVTPSDAKALGRLMQGLGRSYVRYFNHRHGRSGTLWEGRFRSTVVQPSPFVLGVMTFHDLLPVRQGLAVEPRDYAWSSHRHYIGMNNQRFLTAHPLFWALADTPFGREAAYQSVVEAGIGSTMTEQIQQSVLSGWVLGGDSFLQELSMRTGRRLQPSKPGRPRKQLQSAPEPVVDEELHSHLAKFLQNPYAQNKF